MSMENCWKTEFDMMDQLCKIAREYSGNPDYVLSDSYKRLFLISNTTEGIPLVWLTEEFIIKDYEMIRRRTGLTCYIPFAREKILTGNSASIQIWHLAYKTGVSFPNMQFSIYKQASRLTNWHLRLQLSYNSASAKQNG